jgi:hypothetical protein
MMLSAQPATRNGFPAELDDREWLKARYGLLGETTIAAELQVSRKAVRRARERLGIAPPANGAELNGSTPETASQPANGATPTNGSAPTNGVARLALAVTNGNSGATFVSDEELTRRVVQVKKSLAAVCMKLGGLINDLEWVREQVAPDGHPPRPTG